MALLFLASKFEVHKLYSEKEVNATLKEACCFDDTALLRRELYMYRFLNRKEDGSTYWLKKMQPTFATLGLE